MAVPWRHQLTMAFRVLVVFLILVGVSRYAHAQSAATQFYTPDATNPLKTQAVTPATPLPVTGSFSSVTGSTTTAATLIRANNTTTYKAGGAAWNNATPGYYTFTNACATNGGGLTINGIDISSTNNPTLLLSGVLWLFNVVPSGSSILADNATFNIAAADFANLTGGSTNGIPFVLQSAQAAGAGNSGVSLVGTNMPARCAGGSKTLYGIMEVSNQYVPAAQEPLTVTITGITTQ